MIVNRVTFLSVMKMTRINCRSEKYSFKIFQKRVELVVSQKCVQDE